MKSIAYQPTGFLSTNWENTQTETKQLADLPDLGNSFAILSLGNDLEEYCIRDMGSFICMAIHHSLATLKTPPRQVITEMQSQIKDNRTAVVSALGEELVKRIENIKID